MASDIRLSSGQKISPRKSFARFIKSLKAKAGDKWRVTRIDQRRYKIEPIVT